MARLDFEPTGEKLSMREFLKSDFAANNNKYWRCETWPHNGQVFYRATYGRVGDPKPGVDEKITDQKWVDAKIRSKLREYQETELHVPDAIVVMSTDATQSVQLNAKVADVTDHIFAVAGEAVDKFLAVATSALSVTHIGRARVALLDVVAKHTTWGASPSPRTSDAVRSAVQQYYQIIPTKLPRKPDIDEVVKTFCAGFDEQEDRLNQLEAQIATSAAQTAKPRASKYDLLGATLDLLLSTHPDYVRIADYIERTIHHASRPRVRDIFAIHIPAERAAFEREQTGKSEILFAFHGTRAEYVRHIARTGLIVPRTASNGRMFGHGIYFADKVTKSTNYCSTHHGMPHFLFLADVAVGKKYNAPDSMGHLTSAPKGYDSVLGVAGKTSAWAGSLQFNEFIVYKPAQQTLRFLVTFDKY